MLFNIVITEPFFAMKNKLISDLVQVMFSLKSKIRRFQKDLATKTFPRFTSLENFWENLS